MPTGEALLQQNLLIQIIRFGFICIALGGFCISFATAQPLSTDSLQHQLNNKISSSKNLLNKISVGGTIINESRYNSYNWDGQYNPKLYSRMYFIPKIDIGVIPLTGRFNFSTESNLPAYSQYNRFSLQFDSRRFQAQMKEEVKKRLAEKALSEVNPLLQQARDSLSQFKQLSRELQDEKYLQKLMYYQKTLADTAQMDSFSLSQNKFQILNAKKELAAFEDKRQKLQKLSGWKDSLARLEQAQLTQQLNQDSLYAEELKRLPDIYKWASMVQDLQVGTCYPLVSPFTMQGIALNGGYTELQAGRVIAAAGYGTTIRDAFFMNYEQGTEPQKDRLFISSLGYASKKGSRVLLHVLQAGEQGRMSNTPWDREAVSNTVISVEAKQIVAKGKGEIDAEVARSSNTPNSGSNDIFRNKELTSHAARLGGSYSFNKGKTVAGVQARWVGADFYSKGTPFLRRDVANIKASIKQYLWKQYLYLQAEAGKELTNVSQEEFAGSGFTTCMVQGGFSLPGYPSITAGYMPTRQYYEYVASDSNIYSAMDMKFLQMAHVFNIKGMPLSLMAMYSSSKASTLHYQFLNQNFSLDLSAPIHNTYILHASFLQAVTTLVSRPVSYQYVTLDISENRAKGSYSFGAQYRKADRTEISSLFSSYSKVFSRRIQAYIKVELMRVNRRKSDISEYSSYKKTVEAGAMARLSYSF